MTIRPQAHLVNYLITLALVTLAAGIRLGLDPVLGGTAPFFSFLLTVVLIAWLGRTGPAVVALAVSAAIGGYLFVPPRGLRTFADPAGLSAVGVFLFTGGVVVAIGRAMRVAQARAEVLFTEAVAREVNARQAAAAEQGQRELLRATLAGVGDGLIATDAAGRVTLLNPVAERLTGWAQADAAGRLLTDVFRIVNETTRAEVDNPALRALRDGVIVGLANHTFLIARDGTERPIDDSAAPVRDVAGAVVGSVLVFRDITERKRAEADRDRLAEVVAAADDAVVSKTPDGVVTSWNAGAERVFGYTAAEMVGRPITDLIPADRLAEEHTILARIRQGERVPPFETVRVAKGGRLVDVSVAVSPLRDSAGRVVGATKVARDVTPRVRAERVAAEARRRADAALQAGEVGTYYWDVRADRLTGDQNFVALFGVIGGDRDAAPVGDFLAVIHPDDRARVGGEIRRTLDADVPFMSEYRIAGPAGERWVIARGVVERDADGAPAGWAGVVVDVTARKHAEITLRESEEFNRSLLEGSTDCIKVLDPDGRLLHMNGPGLCAMEIDDFGPFCGRAWAGLWPGESAADIDRAVAAARAGTSSSFQAYCPTAKGSPRWWDVAVSPVRDSENGPVVRLLAVSRDVTHRKRAEERLRESERQFRTLFEAMDEGYCVIEIVYAPDGSTPVDFRYLLANPALERHTGLTDIVGRTVRQVLPGFEDRYVERYARVAATGETIRLVDYVAELGRWYELSAFRVGDPAARRVGLLFTDITARKRAEDERQRLAAIVEASPDFIGISDPEGNPIFVNRAGRRLVGLAPDADVTRTAIPDYFVPEERPFIAGTVLPAILSEGRWTGELTFRHFGTGAAIPVLYDLFRVDDPQTGRPLNFATVTRDVTESKHAAARVREADERLRLVLGATADYAVIVTDAGGRIVDWLGGAEAITGFTRDDAVGRPLDLIYTPDDRATGMAGREQAGAAETGRAEDKRWHQKKDGGEFFADGVVVPFHAAGGELRGFAKVFRDATTRKRTEDAVQFLADASASLAELVDYQSTLNRIANLAVGGFADWCVVDLIGDDGRRERLAVTAAETPAVTAARANAAVHPADGAAGVVPHVLRTGEAEAVYDLAEADPLTAPQGPDRLARLQALGIRSYLCVPLRSRGRVIGGMTFLGSSARCRFGPAELRTARDLAERVTVAIENAQLYRTLQEQDRRKDEFLATLAHELRNPLAPVRNGLQILRLGGGGEPAGRTLDMMDRQVGQLVHLVDDLLDLSRVSSGKVVLRPQPLDLREVLDAAVETSRQLIEQGGHELTVALPPEPVWLDADRTRLVQVFANLLNNAGKYTPAGGRVALTAAREGADLVVRVADTGVGIPAEMLPKVFDMFTQVGTSLERSQGGLGIGLTLVRRLVGMHGGEVTAASPGPGKGSTFTVRLPAAPDAAPGGDHPAAGAAGEPGAGAISILVVDDNRDAADSMAMLLTVKGHDVRTAHDGPEALRQLGAFRPRVILLDLGLPGMSGYEVARRVRESPALKGVTIVALTGWGQEEDRRRTREAGFDHHLVKPVDVGELERLLAGVAAG